MWKPLLQTLAVTLFFVACSGTSEVMQAGANQAIAQEAGVRGGAVTVAGTDFRYQFRDVARAVQPAVVSITAVKEVQIGAGMPGRPFGRPFEFFFGPHQPRGPHKQKQQGVGSGVIVDGRGYILTNNHVVEDADELTVYLSDNRELSAEVVGTDPKTDIAVIKVAAKELTPVRFGDSDKLEVGEWVMAVGSPFGLKQTVSAGIVSAIGRGNMGIADYEDFIQTDAAINPGNSGGPLVNLSGELVGINTAIASRTGGNQGIGFAIPVAMAREVMDQLIGGGKVVRGYLGVYIADVTPEMAESFGYDGTGGVLIQDVGEDGPGKAAGMKAGDIVIARDGEPVQDMVSFRNGIARTKPGTAVELQVFRDGKRMTLKVELGALPGEQAVAGKGGKGSDVAELGMQLQDVTPALQQRLELPDRKGALVADVERGSAAASAGLRPGDVIRQVGSAEVDSARAASKALAKAPLADGVRLRVLRERRGLFLILKK